MFSGPRKEGTLTNPILRIEGDSLKTQSESGDRKIWSEVPLGPEPKTYALAISGSSSPKTRKEELFTLPAPQPTLRHTNFPISQPSMFAVHHSPAPTAQIVQSLPTKQLVQDGLAEELNNSQNKVMLAIHVDFKDSVIYL
jgi:hypothetical protein